MISPGAGILNSSGKMSFVGQDIPTNDNLNKITISVMVDLSKAMIECCSTKGRQSFSPSCGDPRIAYPN